MKEKMDSNTFFSSILYFFLLTTLASASPFLSDDIFESGVSPGRSLLQAKKACGVDFENQNYTMLTSQCKGPQYPPKVCCEAFKQFACPYASEINDMTTGCASVMFSYINIYGKYPPGLFANQCKEGKEGLDCSQVKVANSSASSNTAHVAASHSIANHHCWFPWILIPFVLKAEIVKKKIKKKLIESIFSNCHSETCLSERILLSWDAAVNII